MKILIDCGMPVFYAAQTRHIERETKRSPGTGLGPGWIRLRVPPYILCG